MLIGELSKKSGFTKDTIRFYEKNGLIETSKGARLNNNYKDYSDIILRRLEVIKRIKDFGFTLVEIKVMIELFELGVLEQERGRKYIERKIVSIDKKLEELTRVRVALNELVSSPKENCTIRDILKDLNQD